MRDNTSAPVEQLVRLLFENIAKLMGQVCKKKKSPFLNTFKISLFKTNRKNSMQTLFGIEYKCGF